MRLVVVWLLVAAFAAAEIAEEPWVEEEDLEEPYVQERDVYHRRRREIYDGDRDEEIHDRKRREVFNDDREEEFHDRRRREAYVENPYEEHVRVKRRCEDEPEYRSRRSAGYVRVPRQVHQYEVHEFSDDSTPLSPPYEEMLAASAEHYQRVYAAPAAHARYFNPQVSGVPIPVGVAPVASVSHPVQFASPPSAIFPASQAAPLVSAGPTNDHVQFVAPPNAQANVAPVFVPNPVNVPVAPEPLLQPLKQLAGDQYGSAAGHHHKHATGHEHGGGHSRHAKHYGDHGGKVNRLF